MGRNLEQNYIIFGIFFSFLSSLKMFLEIGIFRSVQLWAGAQQLLSCVNIEAQAAGLPRLCALFGIQLPGWLWCGGWVASSTFTNYKAFQPQTCSLHPISNGYL